MKAWGKAEKVKKGGLCLTVSDGAGERSGSLLWDLLGLLLAAALNLSLFAMAGLPFLTPLLAGILVCLLRGLLGLWKKESLFVPGLLGLLLLVSLVAMGRVTDGACLAFNGLGYTWTAASGWVWPQLAVKGGGEALSLGLFSGLVGAVLGLAGLFLARRARAVTAGLGPLCWLGLALLLKNPSLPALLLCLLASLSLLMASGWQRQREALKALCLGGVLTAVLICLLLTAALTPGARSWGAQLAQNTADRLHALRYETKHSYLPEGNFQNFKNKNGEGYTALSLTMDKPEALYLRGFVGDTFDGERWEAIDGTIPAENRELLSWLQREQFFSQTQFAAAAAGLELETSTVTIQNRNGCSAYFLLPYTLTADSLPGLAENRLSPGGARTSGLRGERSYTYEIYSGGPEQTAAVLDALQEQSPEAFRKAEAAWRDYVEKTALSVPESFPELLGTVLTECAQPYGGREKLSFQQAQLAALDVLDRCFGENADVTELPLSRASGSSYQQATVAVLALRYYGIPARYAEGYEITDSMAQESENGSILVDSSCGRAWAEVYQPGIGWMPMEQTPGFEALVGSQSTDGYKIVGTEGIDPDAKLGSTEGEGSGTPLTEGREQDSDSAEKDDTDGFLTGGGAMVMIRRLIRWTLLLLVLGICLLPVLVFFRHWWCIRKKRQLFRQTDCREAIGWIFADAERMLRCMGLDRRGGSLEPVCAMARDLSEDFGSMCLTMTALNAKALFSDHPLSEEQRQEMLLFRSETLGWLKRRVKWYRKLWLRWGLCLY